MTDNRLASASLPLPYHLYRLLNGLLDGLICFLYSPLDSYKLLKLLVV